MGIFDDDFGGNKTCVYERYLKTESVEMLQAMLMFEDLMIPGYEKAFPEKTSFKYEDFLKVKAEREGK